mmetsp:Transcript_10508/g.22590  ORF Transcript_10508/g.22590 Transcript_10508/m.22590 type:complete len:142 (+) Transcript_10508:204-629(+)
MTSRSSPNLRLRFLYNLFVIIRYLSFHLHSLHPTPPFGNMFPLLLGPETGANAQNHQQKHHEERGGPCPRGSGPRIGMIDEDGDEGFEEISFELIREGISVPEVFSVDNKGFGAADGSIGFVEAFASRSGFGRCGSRGTIG